MIEHRPLIAKSVEAWLATLKVYNRINAVDLGESTRLIVAAFAAMDRNIEQYEEGDFAVELRTVHEVKIHFYADAQMRAVQLRPVDTSFAAWSTHLRLSGPCGPLTLSPPGQRIATALVLADDLIRRYDQAQFTIHLFPEWAIVKLYRAQIGKLY